MLSNGKGFGGFIAPKNKYMIPTRWESKIYNETLRSH